MIDIKPPEGEKENPWDEFYKRISETVNEENVIVPINDTEVKIVKELHEINKTLKGILIEMKKRKS